MSLTISARNTVNSWADVGTLEYKFRYLLARFSAMSESSENPSSVEGVTLWTESSFFISFQKPRLVLDFVALAMVHLRNLSSSRLCNFTVRWYLARVFRITLARTPVGGHPASFQSQCQNHESLRMGLMRSFHMALHSKSPQLYQKCFCYNTTHTWFTRVDRSFICQRQACTSELARYTFTLNIMKSG